MPSAGEIEGPSVIPTDSVAPISLGRRRLQSECCPTPTLPATTTDRESWLPGRRHVNQRPYSAISPRRRTSPNTES